MSGHIQIIPDNEIAIDAIRNWAGYAALQRFLGGDAPLQEPCAIADRHIRGSIRQEKGCLNTIDKITGWTRLIKRRATK